ncbi:hypothetical protein ACP70R_043079 [Stipagrostis hirtigluma subsp. patula]
MDTMDSIECVSSLDGMDDDDAVSSSHLPRPFLKTSSAATAVVAAASIGVVPGGGGAAAAGAGRAIPGPLISPATSVHELLECPVCTNSMYPPIHQDLFMTPDGILFWCESLSNIGIFSGAEMAILCVQHAKLGCTIVDLPVYRSWVTSDAWHWKK